MMRCIHIGLLCVQADPSDRPTMSSVVFMLGSELVPLPQPKEPAFYVAQVVNESDQSSSSVKHGSINKLTITNMTPRWGTVKWLRLIKTVNMLIPHKKKERRLSMWFVEHVIWVVVGLNL